MYLGCKQRGFVLVTFFDLRGAIAACSQLNGTMLRGSPMPLEIHYHTSKQQLDSSVNQVGAEKVGAQAGEGLQPGWGAVWGPLLLGLDWQGQTSGSRGRPHTFVSLPAGRAAAGSWRRFRGQRPRRPPTSPSHPPSPALSNPRTPPSRPHTPMRAGHCRGLQHGPQHHQRPPGVALLKVWRGQGHPRVPRQGQPEVHYLLRRAPRRRGAARHEQGREPGQAPGAPHAAAGHEHERHGGRGGGAGRARAQPGADGGADAVAGRGRAGAPGGGRWWGWAPGA